MRKAPPPPLQVWIARPADFGPAMPADLDWLLDDSERERAARFRHEADRRSFVLAHALRRSVLAQWLAADPREVALSADPAGRPVLANPRDDGLHFSHSRTREAVACVVTRWAPVGIDVEPVTRGEADERLIARFVVPAKQDPAALTQEQRNSLFYFRWTALEAFWKSQGTGLADGNPRIECRKNARGHFEIWIEGDASAPRARLFSIHQGDGTAVTLAVGAGDASPIDQICDAAVRPQICNANMQLFNERAAHEMLSAR